MRDVFWGREREREGEKGQRRLVSRTEEGRKRVGEKETDRQADPVSMA